MFCSPVLFPGHTRLLAITPSLTGNTLLNTSGEVVLFAFLTRVVECIQFMLLYQGYGHKAGTISFWKYFETIDWHDEAVPVRDEEVRTMNEELIDPSCVVDNKAEYVLLVEGTNQLIYAESKAFKTRSYLQFPELSTHKVFHGWRNSLSRIQYYIFHPGPVLGLPAAEDIP